MKENCVKYLSTGKCDAKECPYRHPKECKWLNTNNGCKRASACEYLHGTLARDDEASSFKCQGCKDVWTDENCVVKNIVNSKVCYFCLNCNDWIQHKASVFDEGWTLRDEAGYLRTNI